MAIGNAKLRGDLRVDGTARQPLQRRRRIDDRNDETPSRKGRIGKLDPWDVAGAVKRLAQLLAHDLEFGIPDNVPLRGYYLNVLV